MRRLFQNSLTILDSSRVWLNMLSFLLLLTSASLAQGAADETFVGPLPKSVVLKTLIRYDITTLEQKLKGNHSKFAPYIQEIVKRTKQIMLKLGTPVNLEIIGIEYFPHNLTTWGSLVQLNKDIKETRFVSYFYYGPMGVASIGEACQTNGHAIVLAPAWCIGSAENTWAHELGHQLGLG